MGLAFAIVTRVIGCCGKFRSDTIGCFYIGTWKTGVKGLSVLYLCHRVYFLSIRLLPHAKQASLSTDRPVSTILYKDPDFYYDSKPVCKYSGDH